MNQEIQNANWIHRSWSVVELQWTSSWSEWMHACMSWFQRGHQANTCLDLTNTLPSPRPLTVWGTERNLIWLGHYLFYWLLFIGVVNIPWNRPRQQGEFFLWTLCSVAISLQVHWSDDFTPRRHPVLLSDMKTNTCHAVAKQQRPLGQVPRPLWEFRWLGKKKGNSRDGTLEIGSLYLHLYSYPYPWASMLEHDDPGWSPTSQPSLSITVNVTPSQVTVNVTLSQWIWLALTHYHGPERDLFYSLIPVSSSIPPSISVLL